jgi:hypothetical protein
VWGSLSETRQALAGSASLTIGAFHTSFNDAYRAKAGHPAAQPTPPIRSATGTSSAAGAPPRTARRSKRLPPRRCTGNRASGSAGGYVPNGSRTELFCPGGVTGTFATTSPTRPARGLLSAGWPSGQPLPTPPREANGRDVATQPVAGFQPRSIRFDRRSLATNPWSMRWGGRRLGSIVRSMTPK